MLNGRAEDVYPSTVYKLVKLGCSIKYLAEVYGLPYNTIWYKYRKIAGCAPLPRKVKLGNPTKPKRIKRSEKERYMRDLKRKREVYREKYQHIKDERNAKRRERYKKLKSQKELDLYLIESYRVSDLAA